VNELDKFSFKKETENQAESMGQSLFYFALVFKAPLKTFEDVRDFLLKFSEAQLIFQTKSVDYLWIMKAPPKYSTTDIDTFLKDRGVPKNEI
jgi:hypothetical protein